MSVHGSMHHVGVWQVRRRNEQTEVHKARNTTGTWSSSADKSLSKSLCINQENMKWHTAVSSYTNHADDDHRTETRRCKNWVTSINLQKQKGKQKGKKGMKEQMSRDHGTFHELAHLYTSVCAQQLISTDNGIAQRPEVQEPMQKQETWGDTRQCPHIRIMQTMTIVQRPEGARTG